MLFENLKLLLRLYVRPRSTLSMIVDEGSLLFGALAVLVITFFLSSTGALFGAAGGLPDVASLEAGVTPDAGPAPMSGGEGVAAHEPGATHPALLAMSGVVSGFGSFSLLAGLAILYVPGLIFVMSLADHRTGSFGVALTRDYGSIGPCILMSFAAAELLFGVLWMAAGPFLSSDLPTAFLVAFGLGAVGLVYFAVLAWQAVRTVWGAAGGVAFVAVLLPFVVMPFAGYLSLLASPFLLYWIYIYTRGDISAIQWSMGSRRAFKRHMVACTLNPRDAEAHYQLGLIHQHRRQYAEAIARFQKAVEVDPTEIDAHFQLGRIDREHGRHADAIRHFEVVVARDPKYGRHEIWREVGATYFDAGDFANARAMLERYAENRPYDPEGLCLLGQALKKLGEAEKARDVLRQCVDATKTAPEYRRGELRRWRKRAEAEL